MTKPEVEAFLKREPNPEVQDYTCPFCGQLELTCKVPGLQGRHFLKHNCKGVECKGSYAEFGRMTLELARDVVRCTTRRQTFARRSSICSPRKRRQQWKITGSQNHSLMIATKNRSKCYDDLRSYNLRGLSERHGHVDLPADSIHE